MGEEKAARPHRSTSARANDSSVLVRMRTGVRLLRHFLEHRHDLVEVRSFARLLVQTQVDQSAHVARNPRRNRHAQTFQSDLKKAKRTNSRSFY